MAKRSPKKCNAPKETFAQGQLPGEPRTETSKQKSISMSGVPSQDRTSQVSWHAQQPACSPESTGEPSVVDMTVPLREDTLPQELSRQAPGANRPGETVLGGCPGDPKMNPTSTSRAVPLSPIFSLPSFSSLNWISSLSLVSGLGSVLQLSRSSLQADQQEGEFLPSPPQPEQDLCDHHGQTTDYF